METHLSAQEIQETIDLLKKLNGKPYIREEASSDTKKLIEVRNNLRDVIKDFGNYFIERHQGLKSKNQTYVNYIGSKFIPEKYYKVLDFEWFYFHLEITSRGFFLCVRFNNKHDSHLKEQENKIWEKIEKEKLEKE